MVFYHALEALEASVFPALGGGSLLVICNAHISYNTVTGRHERGCLWKVIDVSALTGVHSLSTASWALPRGYTHSGMRRFRVPWIPRRGDGPLHRKVRGAKPRALSLGGCEGKSPDDPKRRDPKSGSRPPGGRLHGPPMVGEDSPGRPRRPWDTCRRSGTLMGDRSDG